MLKNKDIVVTSVEHVQPAVSHNQFLLIMHLSIDGATAVLNVIISKHHKRIACSISSIRSLIGIDPQWEETLRCAAITAFSRELRTPSALTLP